MAPNREVELPVSSSDEEGSESEEASDSESESEDQKNDNKPAATPQVTKTPAASNKVETHQPSDESGSDSESESDSESSPEKSRKPQPTKKPDPSVKPIASKPMESTSKSSTKKPRSKPNLPASPPPSKSSAGAKRPAADTEPKDSKKAKKKVGVSQDESEGKKADDQKKQLFQRLWSEGDEIVLLKGVIDYVAKNGADPFDMNAFHDFIKKSLHIDVSTAQLQDKVRRLKKKFENNARKHKPGKDRTFTKAHEQESFDLSKKIWSPDGKLLGIESSNIDGSGRKNLNQKTGKSAVLPQMDGLLSPELAMVEGEQKARHAQPAGLRRNIGFGRSFSDPAFEEEILKDGLELIDGKKRAELEEKLKKLRMEEVELYLKRVKLLGEQTKLVLEAIKSGEN